MNPQDIEINHKRVKEAAKVMLAARKMCGPWRRALIEWVKKNGALTIPERIAAESISKEEWKQWRKKASIITNNYI